MREAIAKGWATKGRPMTARELAEILLQHPDDIVFVPVPEYSKMEPAVMTMREECYTEKELSDRVMCILVCGES